MLDVNDLPDYIKSAVEGVKTTESLHAVQAAHDFIRLGYEHGRCEAKQELVEELKKYLTGNPWVQLLIDKLEEPE